MGIEEILAKIGERLEQNTQSSNIPAYNCPKCEDTGWIHYWQDGYSFSKACSCQRTKRAESLLKNSGLDSTVNTQTFTNFATEEDWQKGMKDIAISYGKAYFEALDAGETLPWFFLSGQPGCGKTHICTAICGVMMKKDIPVYYMQWITESRRLRALANDPAFDAMLWQYTDVDILYIDDLFKQPNNRDIDASTAEGKVLFEILNTRYLQNKATIISTEWDLLTDLIPVDDGVFTRVYERSKPFIYNVKRGEDRNFRLGGSRANANSWEQGTSEERPDDDAPRSVGV